MKRAATLVVLAFVVCGLALVHFGTWWQDVASLYVLVVCAVAILSWLIGGISHRHVKRSEVDDEALIRANSTDSFVSPGNVYIPHGYEPEPERVAGDHPIRIDDP